MAGLFTFSAVCAAAVCALYELRLLFTKFQST